MDTPELDEALEQLTRAPIATGPSDELKASTVSTMSRRLWGQTTLLPAIQAAQMRRRRMQYVAIAAGVLLLLGAAFLFFTASNSLSFAQVVQQVEKTTTLQGKSDEMDAWHGMPFYIKGKRERWEQNNPALGHPNTYIIDRDSGELLTLFPKYKRAELENNIMPTPPDLYAVIREAAEHPVQPLGEKVVDGRKLVGFSASMKTGNFTNMTILTPVHIWVDPKTKLPVRVDYIDTITGKTLAALTDLRFDEPIDDALLSMKAPDGFVVKDLRSKEALKLRPPPDTQLLEKLILHPGVGVGDVKIGDPPAKLIAFLGEPEFRDGHGLGGKEQTFHYPSVGLRFEIGWDPAIVPDDWSKLDPKDMTVREVFVDAARNGTPGRDFPGATDRGIRIGSTRKEVEAAYGKPAWEFMEDADYRQLGLAIVYADGVHVCGFIILQPSDQAIFGLPEEGVEPSSAPTTQPQP